MTKEFRSLRKKLVIKLGVTYLVALLFVFVLIVVKNTLDFNATIAETQERLKSSLTNKGMLLVQNNSIALVGLVEDNAFGAVEQIVTNTVHSNDDIIYGIFSDLNKNDWVYTFKEGSFSKLRRLVDENSLWAFKQKNAAQITIKLEQLEVVEFAAPVMLDNEIQGVIRYGLSTEELTEAIAAANKQAASSLQQILLALVTVGTITLLLAFWRTDKVARDITIPLNMLTDAANIVASGHYDQTIDIRTNDEVGILASNFNSMTEKIKRTIADLAKINQVGGELATIRNEASAYQKVLNNLIIQLEFKFGVIYQGRDNAELTPLTSSETNVEFITSMLNSHPEVKAYMASKQKAADFLALNIAEPDKGNLLKSLIFMPFGKKNETPLFVVLLSDESNKCIASSEFEFCLSISHLLITSLQNIEMNELLEEQNRNLEVTVSQRTEELRVQNQTLSNTLTELEQTQSQLIEAEKMASLGSLVAGISHEVNTPLGVAVTAASHLNQHTREFKHRYEQGKLTKSEFDLYMETTTETTDIILSNLNRASTLIQSFKQIAVDQSSDTKVVFNLKQHLEMLITSLRPSFKNLPIDINISGDDIDIDSYPGLFNQVVTNLVMNSIKHGLSESQHGKISIVIDSSHDLVKITIEDNGVGIPDDIKNKVFDPFFTTQRGTGGSGLGLNIVYNLVKQKLGGNIHVEDNIPQGARIIVSFPQNKEISIS